MRTATDNLYRILQVDPAADHDVIQAAYRVLARKFHPDAAGSDALMKRINGAWEVLGDPGKRARYDVDRAADRFNDHVTAQASPTIVARPPATLASEHAGPPPGRPFGSVLRFGRYEGWSLGEVAEVDPKFLEWLRRVPSGRNLRDEIDQLLQAGDSAPMSLRRHRPGSGAADDRYVGARDRR
jgi:curved DNA-binding protein CbpA